MGTLLILTAIAVVFWVVFADTKWRMRRALSFKHVPFSIIFTLALLVMWIRFAFTGEL